MTASVILGACLPQKPPASTARPNPYYHPAQDCARLGNKTVPMWYLNKTGFCATKENPRYLIEIAGIIWLRGLDLNQRPSGYEFDPFLRLR